MAIIAQIVGLCVIISLVVFGVKSVIKNVSIKDEDNGKNSKD